MSHFKRISAILIWSGDFKKLAKWYQEMFKFKVIEELSHPTNTGIGLSVGESYLWIGKHSKVTGQSRDPYRIMFNIAVDSVQAAYDDLLKNGVSFIAKPFKAPADGSYFATLQDIDGNVVQLTGPL